MKNKLEILSGGVLAIPYLPPFHARRLKMWTISLGSFTFWAQAGFNLWKTLAGDEMVDEGKSQNIYSSTFLHVQPQGVSSG